jgi:uncharacterized cupredoxin-like copper-binding protein
MRKRICAALIAVASVTMSCSARGGVVVELDEYTLTPDPADASGGNITFTAKNVGSIAHQLVVLRTSLPVDDLPTSDGVVRVDGKRVRAVGEIELVATDDAESTTLDLAPGEYRLICNIASHYDNGMRAAFRVGRGVSPAP